MLACLAEDHQRNLMWAQAQLIHAAPLPQDGSTAPPVARMTGEVRARPGEWAFERAWQAVQKRGAHPHALLGPAPGVETVVSKWEEWSYTKDPSVVVTETVASPFKMNGRK